MLYDGWNKAYWASYPKNIGVGPWKVIMQDDGNLVCYDVNSKPILAGRPRTAEG